MVSSTGKYRAAIVADGAPELCTNGVTCSRSLIYQHPGNRGCMDRKGKKMQNEWPHASSSSSRAVQFAPQGYMQDY